MARVRTLRLELVALLLLAAACVGPPPVRHDVESVRLPGPRGAEGRDLPLLVYRPPGYDDPARRDTRWPLVIHLHGILAEGSNPGSVTREGLPRHLEHGFSPPCVVVSPQLWTFAQRWKPEIVLAVLDDVLARYRVDPERVILLGISSGASTGWQVAQSAPHRFAGFVAFAGWTSTSGVARLRDVPVYAIYGALDVVAPPFLAARGVKAHHACGGATRLCVVPWMSHWVSRAVWESEALWRWILARRRAEPRGPPETP